MPSSAHDEDWRRTDISGLHLEQHRMLDGLIEHRDHTRVLGRSADGVVLVARAGATTRQAAIAANQRLADDGIHLLGTILNDWDPKSSRGGYYC